MQRDFTAERCPIALVAKDQQPAPFLRWLLAISCMLTWSLTMGQPTSWKQTLDQGQGEVIFYWYPNNINIANSKDIIDGVEHELADAFLAYTNDYYGVDLTLKWIQTGDFDEVLSKVSSTAHGVFGASSISITDQRSEYLSFTPPYLADVVVLISNTAIPAAQTIQEFVAILENRQAITISGTTLEQGLLELQQGIDFSMNYVQNSGEIIESVVGTPDGFGYIDLPNFLVALNNSVKIRRQFFAPMKLEGLAFVYPLDTDWRIPVEAYFTSDQFLKDRERIIAKYIGADATAVIERIARSADMGPMEELAISNREKELQYQKLLAAADREQERIRFVGWLVLTTIVLGMVVLVLYLNYRVKVKSNRRLEEKQTEVERSNAKLRRLNEEKNELIQVLAHDLRSPLASILGMSQLISENRHLDDEEREMTGTITRSSKKIEKMISKILDAEAIESGDYNMTLETFVVGRVVTQAIEDLSSFASKKEISIRVQGQLECTIYGDKFYFRQVVENLVSNALKFSQRQTEIVVNVVDLGGNTSVSVTDQGPGISKIDQKKLFRKYQRLTARPTGGESSVGLGLSIVKLYVESMAGNIEVASSLGEGSTFSITLPSQSRLSPLKATS